MLLRSGQKPVLIGSTSNRWRATPRRMWKLPNEFPCGFHGRIHHLSCKLEQSLIHARFSRWNWKILSNSILEFCHHVWKERQQTNWFTSPVYFEKNLVCWWRLFSMTCSYRPVLFNCCYASGPTKLYLKGYRAPEAESVSHQVSWSPVLHLVFMDQFTQSVDKVIDHCRPQQFFPAYQYFSAQDVSDIESWYSTWKAHVFDCQIYSYEF